MQSQNRFSTPYVFVALFLMFVPFSGSRVSGQSSPGSTSWTTADIGSPLTAGSSVSLPCSSPAACPQWSITSAAAGVAGSADQFTFVSQRFSGDGVVTVRVATLSQAASTAGVMIRESLTSGSRHVALLAGPSTLHFKRRTSASGSTTTTQKTKAAGAIWVRLERAGSVITAATSADGSQWSVVGTQTLSLAANVYVGIAVSSGAVLPASATVTNPLVLGTSPTLPAGWASADVGQASVLGTASFSNSAFLTSSAGRGLTGTSDAFRLVYVRITGDATLVARVAATEGPAGRAAGITLRESLDPGAEHYSLISQDGAGVMIARRSALMGSTSSTKIASRVPPVWLKLVRKSNVLTASHSLDGVTWTAAAGVTTAMNSSLYAGLVVAGGTSLTKGAAAFDKTLLVATAANRAPTVSVTSPGANATFAAGATVGITASASDPDDRVARVDFLVNGTTIGTDTTSPFNASWIVTAGTASVVAKAFDFDGAMTTSTPVSIAGATASSTPDPDPDPDPEPDPEPDPTPIPPPPSGSTGPWRLEFEPSFDHATITNYVMEIRYPFSSVALVSKNLGKPPVISGKCVVDVDLLVDGLNIGQYEVVVRAVAASGSSASTPSLFSR